MNRARTAAIAGAIIATICIAILGYDDISGRRLTRAYDQRVAALQKLIKTDATYAPQLEAEHKRLAQWRRDRKARINRLAVALIGGAAIFLWGAKRLPRNAPAIRERAQATAPEAAVGAPRSYATAAPAIDLSVVDDIVAREGASREAAIPILQAIQAHFRYLPDDALRRVCELTEITPAQIAGTSSFYAQLRRTPAGKHVVRVCHGTACHVLGARQITEELRRSLSIGPDADTDAARMFTLDEVACLGCCSLAPVMMIDQHTVGKLSAASARVALDAVEPKEPA